MMQTRGTPLTATRALAILTFSFAVGCLCIAAGAAENPTQQSSVDDVTTKSKAEPARLDLSELVAEYKAAKRDWWERGHHMETTDESQERAIRDVFELDDLMQQAVAAVFERTMQFDQVRRSFDGLIDFRETPRDYVSSTDARKAMLKAQVLTEEATEMPSLVYYQHFATAGEREFYVLHNMSPAGWPGVFPISHAAVTVSNGRARYYRLPEVKDARSAAFFVDLYPDPVYAVPLFDADTTHPGIACVRLNSYRNDSCVLCAIVYDEMNDEWDLIASQHFGFPDWVIDAEAWEFRAMSPVHLPQAASEPAPPSRFDMAVWFRANKASWVAGGRKTRRILE